MNTPAPAPAVTEAITSINLMLRLQYSPSYIAKDIARFMTSHDLAQHLSNIAIAQELTAQDTIKRVNSYIDSLHPDVNQLERIRLRHKAVHEYVSAIAITLATHLAIDSTTDRYERYLHSIPQRYIDVIKETVPQSLSQHYGKRIPLKSKCLPHYLSYLCGINAHACTIFIKAIEYMRLV